MNLFNYGFLEIKFDIYKIEQKFKTNLELIFVVFNPYKIINDIPNFK